MTRTRPRQLRARRIDRVVAAGMLEAAYADGQLDYDEYRRRSDSANSATTVGELDALGVDLQSFEPVPDVEPVGRGRRRRLLTAAAVVVVAAGVVVGVQEVTGEHGRAGSSELRQADVVPIVATPLAFDTAAGLADFRSRYLARFDDPAVISLYIDLGDDTAVVERVAPDGLQERVEVDSGFEVSARRPPLSRDVRTFDVTALDTSRLAERIAQAPIELGRTSGAVDTVNLSYESGSDSPVVRIDVRSEGPGTEDVGLGTVVVDLSGNTVAVLPR
ncbi:DUF1707 domain-containing protein [Rhodococcus sp. BP-349]|uniref:DUF1707 SHOCT-like domain-containing protein n=1 Tax=unclassified Rhodococcus (in: high G+C Gram-positive bacteria) TaxID=192944 RepID=UPI001C9A8C0C|nr:MULTISPECIES: DUF1707 domain-containing protein [unclassified Rhodococcus (in: high G+C Gram-positive bacteria)]MBY6539229.1 DUF1707 domain-containing protein [Rhodococcus sp. BP-363]MBY6544443.1 DUF1707 domain-containing protein [Rhodococcus sp. BP-369]MBY6563673.1 DUF1707 domain-containing protein [Rhodococcus sp. BP-370]MBY6577965.1 DUF1707 domain-containing protein [Rhodococcus sp. BP-364]MBY6587266.1 DUF1707 domain-containing protein [Rhodococcus sp. BP-358]